MTGRKIEFSVPITAMNYGAICVLFGLDPDTTCGGCLMDLGECSCHERGYN